MSDNRQKVIVIGPALTLSGYGEQTRFALRSLRSQEDQYDINEYDTHQYYRAMDHVCDKKK